MHQNAKVNLTNARVSATYATRVLLKIQLDKTVTSSPILFLSLSRARFLSLWNLCTTCTFIQYASTYVKMPQKLKEFNVCLRHLGLLRVLNGP